MLRVIDIYVHIKPIVMLKVTHKNCVTVTSNKGCVKDWKTYVCTLLTTYVHTVAHLWYALKWLWVVRPSLYCWTERPVIKSVQRMTTDIASSFVLVGAINRFSTTVLQNFQCGGFCIFNNSLQVLITAVSSCSAV